MRDEIGCQVVLTARNVPDNVAREPLRNGPEQRVVWD
jgi:hypothetical protein